VSKIKKVKWLKLPEEHDYPAAESYLNLLYEPKIAKNFIAQLKLAKVQTFKSKDIFRASNLSLLGISNSHVRKNKKKIADGKSISPLLLVRNKTNDKVIIADGYHRMCAVYWFDEDALISCKII